jgi:hypothetical protein
VIGIEVTNGKDGKGTADLSSSFSGGYGSGAAGGTGGEKGKVFKPTSNFHDRSISHKVLIGVLRVGFGG